MYKNYIKNEQLNFQINRFLEPYYEDDKLQTKIYQVCSQIKNLEDWYVQWNTLAQDEYEKDNFEYSSAFYQLADFFLEESDVRKKATYERFKDSFYKSIPEQKIEYASVPYKGGHLPVAMIKQPSATKWLVFHGGFDSYLEELIRLSINYLDSLDDYNILMFEGPGQGLPLKEGLFMDYKWEEAVSTILDYFNLNDVCLMGMSLGGYLALRAAAKESRIHKVIAFDIFYSMVDAFLLRAPVDLSHFPDLDDPLVRSAVNKKLEDKMAQDIDLKFKINKAKEIFGKNEAADILLEIQNYTLEGIEGEITQDLLLLAGEEDMYVPAERLNYLKEQLVNASSIEGKLFIKSSGGQFHCQVGNKNLAFERIKSFLK